jgi:recombination protein RecT
MNTAATQNATPAPASPFAIQRQKQPTTVLELLSNDAFRGEIAKVLPKHLPAERMLRVALTTAKMNDKIAKANMTSFAAAMMKCSQYGLEPDGRNAHLIPFKCKDGTYDIQLIFDYKGLASLVRRSGDVSDIHCDVVYENDEFECTFGNGGALLHKPNLKSKREDRGDIYCAYSFVKLKDGSVSYEPMALWEVLDVMENSQGYKAFKAGYAKSSPWETSFAEMAKKTAFRRHTKWLPLSPETKEALMADDDTISDEERFNRAKKVSAEVVAPDFSMQSPSTDDDPTSSSPRTPETEAAGTIAQPAASTPPNPTLGEKTPRKKRAETTPPAQEQQQQAPPQTAEPTAIVPPAPHDGTRMGMVNAIRDAAEKAGVKEIAFMPAVYKMDLAAEGMLLTQLTAEMLQDIITYWTEIVTKTRAA